MVLTKEDEEMIYWTGFALFLLVQVIVLISFVNGYWFVAGPLMHLSFVIVYYTAKEGNKK